MSTSKDRRVHPANLTPRLMASDNQQGEVTIFEPNTRQAWITVDQDDLMMDPDGMVVHE